ncbi:hypothetical protein F5Y15DRAFT_94115 [Xylariaceae sp. FL0016]|nr:hypothetical protein F5Y15DRAFT_94115 [Xylariaceae sp. FL0016]
MYNTPIITRQDAVCPGNGTEIGDDQKFQVLCNAQIGGTLLATNTTTSLEACTEMCTVHSNPRCEGITYRSGAECDLYADITATMDAADATSAMGLLPEGDDAPSTDCSDLGDGTTQTARNKDFTLACSQEYTGDNFDVLFQESFAGCRSTCAAHSLCIGVSYDVTQASGYQNCYLKLAGSTLSASTTGFDSAVRKGTDTSGTGDATETADATATTTVAAIQEASGGSGGGGPPPIDPAKITMIVAIVGAVVGALAVISMILGFFVWRNRRRQRQWKQQAEREAYNKSRAETPMYDESGISVHTTINQHDSIKPGITTRATSDGRWDNSGDTNGLAQHRIVSSLKEYLSTIGLAK